MLLYKLLFLRIWALAVAAEAYDKSGALRDMMQNRNAITCTHRHGTPSSLDAEAIRDEKVKALKAIRQIDVNGENAEVVRGVYEEGLVGGKSERISEEGIPEIYYGDLCSLMLEHRKLAMERCAFI